MQKKILFFMGITEVKSIGWSKLKIYMGIASNRFRFI